MNPIPPNPFDPSASHVPKPLARLFAAIDDVQREYHATSAEALWSLRDACKRARFLLDEAETASYRRPYKPLRDTLAPPIAEVVR